MVNLLAVASQPHRHDLSFASSSSLHGVRCGRSKKYIGIKGQASWLSSVITLANTILGVGLLTMPSIFSRMSIFIGIFVVAWAGCTAGFGLYLQTRCAQHVNRGHASFAALSQLTYPNASILFDAAIAIKCFGVTVSYLVVIGDLMPGVIIGFVPSAADITYLIERKFWITAFMLVVVPLSFLRRLDSLKSTSIIALSSITYLVILVVAQYIKDDTLDSRGTIRVLGWAGPFSALTAFPVTVFAYTCHQNMFSVLNEVAHNSHFHTTTVVLASIGGACALYSLTGITGYLSYGDNVKGNIISMYPTTTAATIGRFAIVIQALFSFALQIHPCRASIDACAQWRPCWRSPLQTTSSTRYSLVREEAARPTSDVSDMRFAIVTAVLLTLSFVTAMMVSSLNLVLAYVGSTGSTIISFILPGLFYCKLSDPESAHHRKSIEGEYEGSESTALPDGSANRQYNESCEWRRTLLRKAALGLASYGLVVMMTCLGTNLIYGASVY